MKLSTIVVVLCILSFALAHKGKSSPKPNKACSFETDRGKVDLSPIAGKIFTVNNTNSHGSSSVWYWTVCGDLSGTKCSPSSAICLVENGTASNWGNASSAQISVMEKHPDGVTLGYAGDICSKNILKGSSLHFHCDWSAIQPKVTNMNKYTCNVDFTIATLYACETESNLDGEEAHAPVGPFLIMFFFTFISCACCICLCACFRRRNQKKQNKKREVEMLQYSDIAFQPLLEGQKINTQPTNDNNVVQQAEPARLPLPIPVQQIPTYYPPMTQPVQLQPPQFFLYPSVQHPMQFQPAFIQPTNNTVNVVQQREEQITDDERLARELQAQYDREVQ